MNKFGILYKKPEPETIKEKFVRLLIGLTIFNEDDRKCDFNDCIFQIIKDDDEDLPILKEKMNNLINLLDNSSIEEKNKIANMDVEDEIWDMI